MTRYFLMLGVFVGLFGGQRVGHFFWGGHFGELGPFLAHFRPKGSNREREREYILLLGFEAAGMAPWDPAAERRFRCPSHVVWGFCWNLDTCDRFPESPHRARHESSLGCGIPLRLHLQILLSLP